MIKSFESSFQSRRSKTSRNPSAAPSAKVGRDRILQLQRHYLMVVKNLGHSFVLNTFDFAAIDPDRGSCQPFGRWGYQIRY